MMLDAPDHRPCGKAGKHRGESIFVAGPHHLWAQKLVPSRLDAELAGADPGLLITREGVVLGQALAEDGDRKVLNRATTTGRIEA